MKFKNKVVIITGSSSGIGKSLAEIFLRNGAKVVISGRNEDTLLDTANELKVIGGEILLVRMDVALVEDCHRLIDETVKRYGRIDILINNAGISMRALFKTVEIPVIEKIMQINFYGTMYCTRYAMPYILKSRGSIVGISSIAGSVGMPGRTGYSASKFAMQGFLDALRSEVSHDGVHVLNACPGFTTSNIRNTQLSADGTSHGASVRDEGKMMSSEECARHIYNAIVKRKRSLVLTAGGKFAVFLNKWWPSMVDKILYKKLAEEEGFDKSGE